jgi:hypothetical protein
LVKGETWEALSMGYAGKRRLDGIEKTVEGLSDQFVNDYLAANPRK